MITSVHHPKELCGTWIDDNGAIAVIRQVEGKPTTYVVTVTDDRLKGTEYYSHTMTLDHLATWRLVGVCKKHV